MMPKERNALRLKLAVLREHEGRGTVLVSLYVMAGRQVYDVAARLRDEVAQAGNIKSRTTRQGVEEALTGALTLVNRQTVIPPNGLVVFSGGGVAEAIEPPEPVPTNLYRCEPTFLLAPLDEMLESKQLFGLVVIDRKEASIGLLHGRAIRALKSMDSHVPQKVNRGGQSQARIQRQADNAVSEWFVLVSDAANALFMPRLDKLTGILVGGPGDTRRQWADSGGLDYRLRAMLVTPTFDTGYTDDSQGLKELVAAAGSALEGMEVEKERKVLGRFFAGLRTGMSLYGWNEVRAALKEGRVDTLLVSDEKDIVYEGLQEYEDTAVYVSLDTDDGKSFANMGGVGALLRW